MPRTRLLQVLAVAAALPAGAAERAAAAAPTGCAGPAAAAAPLEARVDSLGDILAGDGRRIVLAGIAPGDPAATAELAAGLAAALARGPVRIVATAPRPDRWGRWPALALPPDAAPPGLAVELLAAGLAAAEPADLPGGCWRLLLRAEAEARAARRGIWRDGVLQAGAPAAILARAGRFAVVEGRVTGVGARPGRTYLNFGTIWTEDFTVTVSKANLRKVEASGMTMATLEGRRVRVRGVVTDSGGPLIEVTVAEQIERLD